MNSDKFINTINYLSGVATGFITGVLVTTASVILYSCIDKKETEIKVTTTVKETSESVSDNTDFTEISTN